MVVRRAAQWVAKLADQLVGLTAVLMVEPLVARKVDHLVEPSAALRAVQWAVHLAEQRAATKAACLVERSAVH